MGNKRIPKGKRKSPKAKRPGSKSDRDPRYRLIRALLRDGQIHSFDQIFEYIPITVVASDLHIKVSTLHKYLANGASIKIRHAITICEFCELTDPELIILVVNFRRRKEAEKTAKIEHVAATIAAYVPPPSTPSNSPIHS